MTLLNGPGASNGGADLGAWAHPRGGLCAEDMAFVRDCLRRRVPVPHIAAMLNRPHGQIDKAIRHIQAADFAARARTGDTSLLALDRERIFLSLFRGLITRKPTMWVIAGDVAESWGVTLAELVGKGRERRVTVPRQELMFRLHATGRYSLPQIGRFLGDRDHTTVLHGVRQHKARLEAASA